MRPCSAAAGLAALIAAVLAAPAPAAEPPAIHLPPGSFLAGIDLSGHGPNGAKRELRNALKPQLQRPLKIAGRGKRLTVSSTSAGLYVNYERMINSAFRAAARLELVNVPLYQRITKRRLSRTVDRAAKHFFKAGRNARVRFGVRRIKRIRQRPGLAVHRRKLRKAIRSELLDPHQRRTVKARFKRVKPPITLRDLRRIHHTFISVDRNRFTLRLFKRLRVVRRYRIAVGAWGYDTPRGLRRIVSKQVNPAWHAPNRSWAGPLAGQTIPPGDPRNPLKARFMSLGGGYGIHGTAATWSIGTRASHGCIRMYVWDVVSLYARTPLGTPVLIR